MMLMMLLMMVVIELCGEKVEMRTDRQLAREERRDEVLLDRNAWQRKGSCR